MEGAESKRLALLRKLESLLDKEEAETLMAHLPLVDWSRLVTTDDLDTRLQALRADLRSELSDVRAELSGLRSEVHSELSDVRPELSDVRSELSDVRSELSDVRSELSDVRSELRLEMARWGRTHVYTTIGAVAATAGLAFAAAGLS